MEFEMLKGKFTRDSARQLNPLVLAFVGDAIYEIFVRTYIVDKNRDMSVHKLHLEAISFVKAHEQSELMKKILDDLSEEELSIYKRGRNSKSAAPKNANMQEYRTATGFEALLGYLYLTEQVDRLNSLFHRIIDIKYITT
ncbi:MAG: ribonuclease III domain-containing protein [Bacillota bacterium]|nr:ribonuclease III domain-containing protein [Bacillota bacterium]